MREPGRAVVGVVGIALAVTAGGCRQLFGIDDTDVALDAAGPDAASDGPVTVMCSTDHVLCMDFDTTETGISQLPFEMVSNGATIGEADDSDAPSPPRVLRATMPGGAGAASALRIGQFGAGIIKSARLTMALWVSAAAPGETCSPLALAILWGDPVSQTDAVGLSVDAQLELNVEIGGVQQVTTVGFPRNTWVRVVLDIDSLNERVKLSSDFGVAELDAPGLAGVVTMTSFVGVGISVEDVHGACAVAMDDVVLDAPAN